jgi:nucleoside-diphosphate-sugar epimerase
VKVLVTGGSGFIGRHAVPALRERGFEVVAPTSAEADLLQAGAAEALIESVAPTHLLHLAWYAKPGAFWTAAENLAWAQRTFELYRAFADAGGQRAVLAGTCAEYDWSDGLCVEDRTPLRPSTLYGACKQATGVAVTAYGAQHGPSTAWGRVFFLYGPGEPEAKLVASVVAALKAGRRAPVTHGRQVRDFLHVADVAGAFAALVASDGTGAVNIGSGEGVALRELLTLAEAQAGTSGLVAYGERQAPEGEPPVIVADVTRLRDEVGFAPRFTLATGLADLFA